MQWWCAGNATELLMPRMMMHLYIKHSIHCTLEARGSIISILRYMEKVLSGGEEWSSMGWMIKCIVGKVCPIVSNQGGPQPLTATI